MVKKIADFIYYMLIFKIKVFFLLRMAFTLKVISFFSCLILQGWCIEKADPIISLPQRPLSNITDSNVEFPIPFAYNKILISNIFLNTRYDKPCIYVRIIKWCST